MEQLSWRREEQVRAIREEFGTPVFVYDQETLEEQARQALAFPNAYGLTVRYAMKACPSTAIIRLFSRLGLHIDASSGWEAHRAMEAGVEPEQIQLTAQELPEDLSDLVSRGVLFNACSLHQLAVFGGLFRGREVSLRVNPGLGSGHSNRTNVGGPSASFGLWHEHLDRALQIQDEYDLAITALHSHIGSGSDPEVWQRCARLTLQIAARLPGVRTVNLGGGYKVGRMAGEASTDLQVAGQPIVAEFEEFSRRHGRRLRLEIEPGTFLVASAGSLVCSAVDIVDTGADGHTFIKVDAGMTEILRPSMYGAQHPIVVVPAAPEDRGVGEYLVAGHCCESGDILTPAPDNPEGLGPRQLCRAEIGDVVVIGGTGAYGATMSASNYNSFPEAPEILVAADGDLHLIRRRQTLAEVTARDVVPEFLESPAA